MENNHNRGENVWQIKADELAEIFPLAQLSNLAFAVNRQLLTTEEAQKFIISSLNEQPTQKLFDLAIEANQFTFKMAPPI